MVGMLATWRAKRRQGNPCQGALPAKQCRTSPSCCHTSPEPLSYSRAHVAGLQLARSSIREGGGMGRVRQGPAMSQGTGDTRGTPGELFLAHALCSVRRVMQHCGTQRGASSWLLVVLRVAVPRRKGSTTTLARTPHPRPLTPPAPRGFPDAVPDEVRKGLNVVDAMLRLPVLLR